MTKVQGGGLMVTLAACHVRLLAVEIGGLQRARRPWLPGSGCRRLCPPASVPIHRTPQNYRDALRHVHRRTATKRVNRRVLVKLHSQLDNMPTFDQSQFPKSGLVWKGLWLVEQRSLWLLNACD